MRLFNRPLRILLSTNALILLSGAMLGPIYALYVDGIGGSLLDASFAGAIFAVVAGVTVLVSGRLSDSIKESELIIVVGYAVMGVGFFLYIIVDSIAFLFIVQAIIGLGEALYSPAFDSVYSKHIALARAGRQWSAWESMYYFTAAIGAAIGGAIASAFGFTPLFVVMGLLCFASALYIYALPRKEL